MAARSQGPYYDVDKFIKACRSLSFAVVSPQARKRANDDFSLYNDTMILNLIFNDKLPNRVFDNQAPLDKGAPKDIGLAVDSYRFKIGPKPAYIAFYRGSKGIWVIKSFHTPDYEGAPALTHRLHIPFN